MSDKLQSFDQVVDHLAQWQRRRLQSDAMIWLPRGLLAGLVAAAGVAALARFQPILLNQEVTFIALALALVGLFVGFLVLLLRQPTLLEQARFFDRRFALQERLSAAVEIERGQIPATEALRERQLANTLSIADGVDARSRLPLRPHWPDLLLVLLTGILLVLAMLLPNDQAAILVEQQAVASVIEEEIARLQALESRLQNDPVLDETRREALLEPIRAAIEALEQGGLSREEAVAVLSEAEAGLRELSESGNGQAIRDLLQGTGQLTGEDGLASGLGGALANGALSQAAATAHELADALSGLSASEREILEQNLMEAASALAEVDPLLGAELADAAEALRGGDLAQAQQSLREVAAALQEGEIEQAVAELAELAAEDLLAAREEVASAGLPTSDVAASGSPVPSDGRTGQVATGQGQNMSQSGSGQSVGPGAGLDAQEGQGAGGPGPGGGHADTVFVPGFADLSGEDGVQIQLPAECVANPENCGPLISERATEFVSEQSLVPYEQVFGDYRDAAFAALEGDYVPLGMKGLVREYFSSLEP